MWQKKKKRKQIQQNPTTNLTGRATEPPSPPPLHSQATKLPHARGECRLEEAKGEGGGKGKKKSAEKRKTNIVTRKYNYFVLNSRELRWGGCREKQHPWVHPWLRKGWVLPASGRSDATPQPQLHHPTAAAVLPQKAAGRKKKKTTQNQLTHLYCNCPSNKRGFSPNGGARRMGVHC